MSVRRLSVAGLLLLISCDFGAGRAEIPAREALAAAAPSGLDFLVLRVPRSGGRGRVMNFPALDSTLWTSAAGVPSITRVLSFDVNAGSVLYVDSRGTARSLDFRLGAVSPATQLRLTRLTTSDGWNVYGIAQGGSVGRSTPSAIFGGSQPLPWSFKPSIPAREVFPLSSGALIVVGANDSATVIWRVYPPEIEATDSIRLGKSSAAFRSPTGDRVFLTVDKGIVGIASKDLQKSSEIRVRGGVREIVATPSGNQLFLVGDSINRVFVFDRYKGAISGSIRFPQPVSTVRMDPLGRFLLGRAFVGDTAWIVALSNYRSVRPIVTQWRPDLPGVVWDGGVAVVRGRDVLILDPVKLDSARTIKGGAADYWHFFTWNGFRQRAVENVEPVNFPVFDSTDFVAPPTKQAAIDDSVRAAFKADSILRAESAKAKLPTRGIWTVSFAVLRNDSSAVKLARGIRVRGQSARVVEALVDATRIFRVVLGPYPSRSEAETVGRAARIPYWVYEGPP